MGLRGAVQFPRLEPPPADFVGQIEEYVASVAAVVVEMEGTVEAFLLPSPFLLLLLL